QRKTIQGSKIDSLRKTFSASELSNRNEQDGSQGRSKEMRVFLPPQMPNDESWKGGGSDGNHLSLPERVKVKVLLIYPLNGRVKLPIFYSGGSLVLPGEVEQTMTYCTPFFDKPIELKFRTSSVPQPSDRKAQGLLGYDVQLFSFDEEFDYDNVALALKFSEAELMAIIELSEEKK
ncbi:Uncharacterized protein C11orf74, partial [Cuculus canorus]